MTGSLFDVFPIGTIQQDWSDVGRPRWSHGKKTRGLTFGVMSWVRVESFVPLRA